MDATQHRKVAERFKVKGFPSGIYNFDLLKNFTFSALSTPALTLMASVGQSVWYVFFYNSLQHERNRISFEIVMLISMVSLFSLDNLYTDFLQGMHLTFYSALLGVETFSH